MGTRRHQLPDDFDQTIFDHLPAEELSPLSKYLNHDQLLSLDTLTLIVAKDNNLHALKYFLNLQYLRLKCDGDIDLTPLASLTSLKHLTVSNANLENINFLIGNPKLTNLDFSDLSIADYSQLPSLTQLKSLRLRKCEIDEIP